MHFSVAIYVQNAGDMIGALTMKYNRGRQASITNELVDIITGASGMYQFFFLLSFVSYDPPWVPVRVFPHTSLGYRPHFVSVDACDGMVWIVLDLGCSLGLISITSPCFTYGTLTFGFASTFLCFQTAL